VIIINTFKIFNLIYINHKKIIKWGLGIGDWGLGIGDWAQSPIPNPQSPIPNPQSPSKKFIYLLNLMNLINLINLLIYNFKIIYPT